jgi:hypothetical protein
MEKAAENGKESSHSAHAKGMNDWMNEWIICLYFQRKNKYNDAKLKALKARNEYVLCLEAANTTIHKYFVDDLSDLIDVSY